MKILLKKIRTICGITFVELLEMEPALHKMKLKSVMTIKKIFEQHNMTHEQIKKYPRILLMDEELFLNKWKTIISTPELRVMLRHPMLVKSFANEDNFETRLNYLRYLNLSDITFNLFIRPSYDFERCIKSGIFRKRAMEISSTLGSDLKMDSVRIGIILSKHSLWRHVTLFSICETFNYLKSQFEIADIEHNLHAILYPKNKVESVLKMLIHENELMDYSNRYTPSQLLALCTYVIEKKFHFTGDGVWNEIINQQENYQMQ